MLRRLALRRLALRRLALRRLALRRSALALLLAAAVPAAAQEAPQRITFNEAIAIALDQNTFLERAANTAELRALGVARARARFMPDLGFSSSGSQSYGRTFDQESLSFLNQTTESMSLGVGTSVNVFNGFADVATHRQARLAAASGDLDYERARQGVVFNVISTYINLIERREQILVQEENLASQRQLLAQVEEFVRVGARPISDQYQQEAAVANAELALLQAEQLYQLTETALIQILQLDPFGRYEFVAPDLDDAVLTAEAYQLGELLRSAFERRPDLEAGEIDIQAAEQGIRVAKSSRWPRLGLNLSYGSGWYSEYVAAEDLQRYRADLQAGLNPAPPSTAPFLTQLDERRGGSLGLSFSVPIFDRFATRNSIQQAQVEYENAQLALQDLRQDIAVQVRQAYIDYEAAQKTLDVTQKQLRAAELALEAEQERYAVGAATLVEVAQARAAFVRAAGDRVQARYDFIFREKLIDYYIGVMDPGAPLFD